MARTTPVNSGYQIISGSATGSNKAYVDVWLEWKQLSTDVAANTSTVRVVLYAQCTKSSSTAWTVAEKFGYVTCDGDKQERSTTYNFAGNAVNCFGDCTYTVSHKDDGSKSVSLEGAFYTKSTYISGGSVGATTVTLETIPRASSFGTITGTTLGSTMRVNINRNSTSFTHKVYYYKGENAWIGPAEGSTYADVELPISLAEKTPDGKTLSLLLLLRTYHGSSQVGEDVKEYVNVTVPENDDTRPSVSMTLEAVQPAAMAEDSPLYGLYLQGITRIKAALEASGKLGAEIDPNGYSLEVEGVTYGSPYLADPVYQAAVKVTGKAVDTRGIPGTATQEITVLPYSKPTLTAKAYRCLADKSQSDTGTFLKIDAAAAFAPVEVDGVAQNTGHILWRIRSENGTFPDTYTQLTDEALLDGTLATDTAYEVEILAVDAVTQSIPVYIQIPTESIYKHKRAGGKGMGLGGYCDEDELLDVHWNARIRKTLRLGEEDEALTDFVVEQGSVAANTAAESVSILWRYRKWHSGIAECWGTSGEVTVDVTDNWTGIYSKDNAIPSVDYPFPFESIQSVSIMPVSVHGNFWMFTGTAGTNSKSPTVSIARPNEMSGVRLYAHYHVIGRWKSEGGI